MPTRPATTAACLAAALTLAACSNPADETYTTEAAEAQDVPAVDDAELGTTYALSADNTTVEWTGSKPGGAHDGGFNELTGTLALNADNDAIATLDATIRIDSLYSDNEGLTAHLLNEDFFKPDDFPTSAFAGTEIRPVTQDDDTGELDGATHMVTGNFTLLGETHSITFPAVVDISDAGVTINTTFDINRSQWGMDFGLVGESTIRDEVVIRLNIDTTKD